MQTAQRTEDAYGDAFFGAVAPDPKLTVSEWADDCRRLTQRASAEPGPWRTSRAPYLREIMDCLSPSSLESEVVFMKGSQVGGTECGNNWLGYIIHKAPGPMMYVLPTVETAKRTSRQRIAPMIDETPELRERVKDSRSRDSGNTLLMKEFPNGLLILTGANSGVGLRSMPCRFLFLDEVDAYPLDVDGEGDPVGLAIKRTATFRRNRKIFLCSTPGVKGESRIEDRYENSDKREYHVPCANCGTYQKLEWSQIKWTDNDPDTAVFVCASCGKEHAEQHKTEMLEKGKWVKTREGLGLAAGFHLSSLYSPVGWYSWADAARDFLGAQNSTDRLKVWTNTVVAETWEDEGEEIDTSGLHFRREHYPAEVPEQVIILTAAVDVQDDRLEAEIQGWGEEEENWSIDFTRLYGDLDKPGIWNKLADWLRKPRIAETGEIMDVKLALIDSGGHYTDEVYKFSIKHGDMRFVPIKGASTPWQPIATWPRKRNVKKVYLVMVGTDTAKEVLAARLRQTEPGPGYRHWPIADWCDEEHFSQLSAEKLVKKYRRGFEHREWHKTRPRNEALDLSVYNLAAIRILQQHFHIRLDGYQARQEAGQEEEAVIVPAPITHPDPWLN